MALVLQLEPTPPANAFVTAQEVGKPQACFPLDLFFCRRCAHVQLLDVVDPRLLFEDYVYVSGTSALFRAHFEAYADEVIKRYRLWPGELVVDIGSNDGTLLTFFRQRGMRVVGIDPAKAIAETASRRGIETLPEFFTVEIARSVRQSRGAARLVTANNVFAHVDDLKGFVEGVRELLCDDGLFIFEVSYLVDVYQKTLFDTIYHEHLSYHRVKPLLDFFARAGLEMIEARRVESHGGSLRGVVQKKGGPEKTSSSVEAAVAEEERLGLDREETLRAFSERIARCRKALLDVLQPLRREGKRVAGFGAPAKATTLMHHFHIGPEIVEFIADDNPLKQGLFTPGLHVPVVPASEMYQRSPDYLVLLAWNFARPVMKAHWRFHQEGGKFIVPLPEVEVV